MGCIIEQYPNTKLWAKLLEIEADVLNIIHERLSCTQNSPSLAGTGETIRFSISVIDNDTGPIAEDEIVAGTYDLIRVRNNIETTIVNDGAFSKRDGFVYIDIDFDTATWDLDDSYMLLPNQDSTAVIDGTTYYLPLAAWSGMILDLSDLETNVNTIITTLGTPAGASVSVDIADIEAKLDNGTYGLAALNTDLDALLADVGDASGSGLGSLYNILGNPAQTFTAMVGYEGATSLANKLTAARAGYLDNINTIITTLGTPAGASIAVDIADLKATFVDSLGSAVEGAATGLNLTAASGAASSEDGADVLTFVTGKRKEIIFLGVSMANITAAATVSVRMYTKVLDADATLTKFYDEDFTQGTDPDLIPVIDGSMGIRNNLRVEMHSTAASDTDVSVPFHYIYKSLE